MHIEQRLKRLGFLFQDVSKYDEEDSETALITLEYLKDRLIELDIEPFATVPHEEGITLVFIDPCHYKYCSIEIMNVGISMLIMVSALSDTPVIKLLEEIEDLQKAINDVALFLKGAK